MMSDLPYVPCFRYRVGKELALTFLLLSGWEVNAQVPAKDFVGALKFVKQQLASESFESVAVFDVNDDQLPDIVSGGFWYQGPEFTARHAIGSAQRYGEYWDDFSTVPMDVNGDGRTDFITGGWFGKRLVWKENPGTEQEWPEHLIAETGNVETTAAWDVDGDGTPEIIPNTPNDSLIIYRLVLDRQGKGTGMFRAYPILGEHGHGLGFGDINGDGRGDLIVHHGWAEAPERPYQDAWTFHADFDLDKASIPIVVTDVNQDGQPDLIAGQAHDYGLDWYEQRPGQETGKKKWIKHPIDPYHSQFHTMQWVDLDDDGEPELVTGKRYRAHNGKDPGGNDHVGIYYYQWNGESFSKQVVSYGPPGEGKGLGIYFSVADVNGSGKKDIVAAGKDGLFVFYNQGSD